MELNWFYTVPNRHILKEISEKDSFDLFGVLETFKVNTDSNIQIKNT